MIHVLFDGHWVEKDTSDLVRGQSPGVSDIYSLVTTECRSDKCSDRMRGHVYASATRAAFALIASVASRTVTGLSPKFVIPSAKSVTRPCV